MVDPSNFGNLARDLRARADVVQGQADALRRTLDGLAWQGPSRNRFNATEEGVLRDLDYLVSLLSQAADDAAHLEQDFSRELQRLHHIETAVRGWLGNELMRLGAGIIDISAHLLGISQHSLPPTGSPRWHGVYETARARGCPG